MTYGDLTRHHEVDSYFFSALVLAPLTDFQDWRYKLLADTLHPSPAIVAAYNHFLAEQDGVNAQILREAVVKEWPSISKDDPSRIAYTRSPEHGQVDRRTKCSLGSWINRILPDVFGGRAMDALTAIHNGEQHRLEYLADMDAIVDHMVTARHQGCGFGSCMTAEFDGAHPYEVYSPKYGWKLALLLQGNHPVARALVNDGEFVRVYGLDSNKIATMTSALEDDGNKNIQGWGGRKIAAIHHRGEYLGPYIDGSATYGDLASGCFRLEFEGEYEFQNIDGTASEAHCDEVQTEDGDWIPEDDAVYIEGSGYRHRDDCVNVDGDWLLRAECTRLANGDWVREDDAVDVDGQYYLLDDVTYDDLDDKYILNEDAVEYSSGWTHQDNARELRNGDWELTEDCQELEDGTFVLQEDAVELFGVWYAKEDCKELEDGTFEAYPGLEDAATHTINMPEVAIAS